MDPTGPKLAGISRQSRVAAERRHAVRHRAHSPAYATLDESQRQSPELSEILDISENGISIQTSAPLPVEHNIDLCLDLSETRVRIRTTGHVIWSDPGRAGIYFPQLMGQSLEQLKEWLFVNILTAFDHARQNASDPQVWNSASNQPLLSNTMPKGGFLFGTPMIPGNGRKAEGGGVSRATSPETKNRVNRDIEVQPKESHREDTLQSIAERALNLTRATGAAIALAEGSDGEMTCVASAGSDAPAVGSRVQASSGFSGECVRTGRSLRCDDSETDDRVDREGCRALGIRSIVAVPIRLGTKVAGLAEVFSPQAYAFSAHDISTIQELTGKILTTPGSDPRPAPATTPARTRQVTFEKRPPSEAPAAAPASAVRPVPARPPKQLPVQKILLVAAIGTFVFAILWLIAPWVSSQLSSSSRAASHPQAVQASSPKPSNPSAGVGDLATLRKAAEQGDPAAQFALGARYATGEEVKQDYTEAVRWFTMAAEQGHILAQATLGAYYWAGRGVPQDLTKAYYWSVLAQAGGDQASKYRVAVLTSRMSRGQVVTAQQQADEWLRNFARRTPASR